MGMFEPPGTPAKDMREALKGKPVASFAFEILDGPKEARDDGLLFI